MNSKKSSIEKIYILIPILILIGCCKEPKLLKNGLTKKANSVTEISINVEHDSLNNKILDTLSVTKKFYNDNNKIIKRIQNTLFDKETIEIDYIYDKSKKLQQEIVKLSFDTITVNYFYKDTLLSKISSKTSNSELKFEHSANHRYSPNNQLSEVSTSEIIIEKESGDTMLNSLKEDCYNGKEQLKESQIVNFTNPEKSVKYIYKYKCERLINTKDYNQKDSLILMTNFEYTFDKFDNWTERKSIENKELKYILKRKIEYNKS